MFCKNQICHSKYKIESGSADRVTLQFANNHLSNSEVTLETEGVISCNNLQKTHDGCCLRRILDETCLQANTNLSDIMILLKAMIVLLSSDAGAACQSMISSLVSSNDDATVVVKEQESIVEKKLPLISFSGVDVPCSETSLYICNYGSWMQLQSLVHLVSSDCFAVFGNAHSALKKECNTISLIWNLEPYSLSKEGDAKKKEGYMWFWIPVKFKKEFHWIVTKRFNLYTSIVQYKEFPKDHDEKQSINIWKINMVHDTKDDLIFFSDVNSETFWTEELMCRFITESKNSSECDDTGSARAVSKPMKSSGFHKSNKDLRHESHDKSHTSIMFTGVIEVHEMDLSQIKEEISENEKSSKPVEKSSNSRQVKKAPRNKLENLRNLFVDYAKVFGRGFHGSEPMLIVQCPACLAQFRGLSDRMLQLINHIKNNHSKKSRKKYTTLIENSYRPLIVLAKKRLKEWRLVDSHQ